MTMFRKAAGAAAGFIATMAVAAGSALAQQSAPGAPYPWQMVFQPPATPVMRDLTDFHTFITWLITAISIFVLAVLLYIVYRFNAKSNPVPSKTTHNAVLEVVWTVVPIAILVIMAIPSFRLLYNQDVVPDAARVRALYGITVAGTMDVKATGVQWNWEYEYPGTGVKFAGLCSNCFAGDPVSPTSPRLLDTTDHVVVPVNTLVRVLTTATDVIHAWAVPSFGVKIDAVPGRVNQTWFVAEREGLYFGQCSELCGQGHGFMPIAVEVVSMQRYDQWVTQKRAEIGLPPLDGNLRLAQN